ncbi:hypothetical protein P5G51_000610 [Virgibacillus sp. 179-BFC.A HS]|uniref:Uncharacterized protein n=1 Tax=Tigheibacillus jepli TaxID=3035914 RepID=A0ABU5CF14_9BACI|nr:hypothetical protein [Virgibacillus sp. 179-BFC.A HS]MDY0404110.1 hypothetical protein [Virgibacillus sp. 179-BFC.A HS]
MKPTEIYSFLSYLQSQQTAQAYLRHCYRKLPEVDAEKKAMKMPMPFYIILRMASNFMKTVKNLICCCNHCFIFTEWFIC